MKSLIIDNPPVLPDKPTQSWWRKLLPIIISLMVAGMFILFIFASFQSLSIQNLLYPFIILLMAIGVFQTSSNKENRNLINLNRVRYLDYLTGVREELKQLVDTELNVYSLFFPDPKQLLWYLPEKYPLTNHCGLKLHARIGTGTVNNLIKVNYSNPNPPRDNETYDPVCIQAATSLIHEHTNQSNSPVIIDLNQLNLIFLTSRNYTDLTKTLAATLLNLTVMHDPSILKIHAVSPKINNSEWEWIKWLPHTLNTHYYDDTGYARHLYDKQYDFMNNTTHLISENITNTINPDNTHTILIIDACSEEKVNIPYFVFQNTTIIVISTQTIPVEEMRDTGRELFINLVNNQVYKFTNDKFVKWDIQLDRVDYSFSTLVARRLSDTFIDMDSLNMKGVQDSRLFCDALQIPDASMLDVKNLWDSQSRDMELRTIVGKKTDGSILWTDFKEAAEGGSGPHGLIIGMTGSGKSQTISQMLLSLILTHSANRLNIIYADFKGEAEADSFKDFPQVIAVISNMEDKTYLTNRFVDTLLRVVEDREIMLRDTGRVLRGHGFKDVTEYEMYHADNGLTDEMTPIPALLLVADEFTIMLQDHPEYINVFDRIARKGRSLRIHILFASQTLDTGRMKEIDQHISFRICLKVNNALTSKEVIGTTQAADSIGAGYHGIGYYTPVYGESPTRFKSFYVKGDYNLPTPMFNQSNMFNIASFTATNTGVLTSVTDVDSEIEYHKFIPLVKDQLKDLIPKASKLWLEPLTNTLLLPDLIKQHPIQSTDSLGLQSVYGLIDDVKLNQHTLLLYDTSDGGGHLIVYGSPQSGKSTILLSVVTSLSYNYSGDDALFYIIAQNGCLTWADNLNSVCSVSNYSDEERLRLTFTILQNLLSERAQKSEYCLPHVFLVIDDLYTFIKRTSHHLEARNKWTDTIIELLKHGSVVNIHVLSSTTSWLYLPQEVQSHMLVRLETKLATSTDSMVPVVLNKETGLSVSAQKLIPPNMPGMGVLMNGKIFSTGIPSVTVNPSEFKTGFQTLATSINNRYKDCGYKKLTLLPAEIMYPIESSGVLQEHLPIGVCEPGNNILSHDFTLHPILMIIGDKGSGKTMVLQSILTSLHQLNKHKPVLTSIIDMRGGLKNMVTGDWEYVNNPVDIPDFLHKLTNYINKQSDTHQLFYILIDDVMLYPDNTSTMNTLTQTWANLIPMLNRAVDVNIRIIVSCKATDFTTLQSTNNLIRQLSTLNPGIILLNSKNASVNSKILGLPVQTKVNPGRGLYVPEAGDDPRYIQTFMIE